MGTEKRKNNRVFFYSTPHTRDDMILKRFLDQENNDPSEPILSLKDMKWITDVDRSHYPYGLGKEWELKI